MNTTFLCIFTLKGVKIFLRANDGLLKQGDMNMRCSCCNSQLNSGRVFKRLANGALLKSCPHCSVANGSEHVFHRHPQNFGQTPARVSARNPDGDQSYCIDCRALDKGEPSKVSDRGNVCSSF
ncbi:hypothetical protein AB4584_24230 [Vibrio splendidus]|uniref:hypothetical protein n=2 Tax=Vibrionaceae TaxID=641 RepID=UPI001E5D8D49|nr:MULTISPECIES: hypothetical protein [Vibrio]MDH5935049.1 hypothetical protein [Vibrio splendidus]